MALTERTYYTWDKQGELGHIGVKRFSAVFAVIFFLLLLYGISFAQQAPVYTEGVSYQIEVTETGHIQVRKATRVYKDGVEISKTYHRHVVSPGDDTTKEIEAVKKISAAVWTPAVIKAYRDSIKKTIP